MQWLMHWHHSTSCVTLVKNRQPHGGDRRTTERWQWNRLLVPLDEAMHQLGDIGRTKLYELFDAGEIVRVNVGRRSFVLAESIAAYVDRLSETASAHVSRD